MTVPPTILRLLQSATGLRLDGTLVEPSVACEAAKHHSPRPLLVCEYRVTRSRLEPLDGDTVEEGTVWLCGTCSDNVNVALALYDGHDGVLPWQARRELGNLVRAIAERPYGERSA